MAFTCSWSTGFCFAGLVMIWKMIQEDKDIEVELQESFLSPCDLEEVLGTIHYLKRLGFDLKILYRTQIEVTTIGFLGRT